MHLQKIITGKKLVILALVKETDRCEFKNYFDGLHENDRKKFVRLLRLVADHHPIRNEEKFRHEEDGIYALKSYQDRGLCFFEEGKRLIITHGFKKKKQKLPRRHLKKAKRLRDLYMQLKERKNE